MANVVTSVNRLMRAHWLALGAMVVCLGMYGTQARAQSPGPSLNDQYAYYLMGKCQNLGFTRGPNNVLTPGQAGPQLAAFCSGPPPTGGVSEASSLGGGATAEEISNSGGEEDEALKRRRGRLREPDSDHAPAVDSGQDAELASSGATSVFASFDWLRERQTATEFEDGRHSTGYDGLLGIDRRFGDKALAGIALRYAEQSGTFDSGGDFSVHTPGVSIYGSWLPVNGFFLDGAVGFDRRGLDTHRIVTLKVLTYGAPGYPPNVSYNPPPASADSTTDERDLGAELHSGYDFSLGSLTVGPRASVTFAHSDLDPYTETGDTPMTLAVNEQTRTSLRSQLGFQLTDAIKLPMGVLVPQLNADWLHEYRDPQQMLSAHFAEDLRPDPVELHFLNNPPDRDWFVIRAAAVVVLPHGFSGFAAVARTAGNLYIQRVQATLGVRMEL